jgi:hypothetical protein
VSRPARYLLFAQVGFFLSLVVCMVIDPTGLGDNHGWSYYEGRDETFFPYLLGFFGCVLMIVYAAVLLERSPAPAGLSRGLRLLSFFLFLDIATPDTVNVVFWWAHDVASTLLFLFELGFAVWLVRTVSATRLNLGLLVLQFISGVVAMFSQLQVISQLGVGILLFQVSFGVMLVVTTARIPDGVPDVTVVAEEAAATAANH